MMAVLHCYACILLQDGAPTGYELIRTVSSSGRPSSSGYRSASNDPAARARKPDAPVEGWTDPKSRDPYAQFFMQRATGTTGVSGDGAVYFTTSKPAQPTVYYGATNAAPIVPSGTQIDPSSRSLFRRNHAASRPSDDAPVALAPPQAGSERVDTAWAVTSRQRPASAASVRPGSAARVRGDGTAPQNMGEAIAIDATALINSAAAKVASYSRPSSAATESRCVL
jgi:hypothetical protein